jgi:hypothetical protein
LVFSDSLAHFLIHDGTGSDKGAGTGESFSQMPSIIAFATATATGYKYELCHDSSPGRGGMLEERTHPAKKNPGLLTRGCRFSSLWPYSRSAKSMTRICLVWAGLLASGSFY